MTEVARKLQHEGWSTTQIKEITCAQWFMWFADPETTPEARERTGDGGIVVGEAGSIREAVLIAKARKKKREKEEKEAKEKERASNRNTTR